MEVELTDPMVKTDIFDQYWSCLIFSLSEISLDFLCFHSPGEKLQMVSYFAFIFLSYMFSTGGNFGQDSFGFPLVGLEGKAKHREGLSEHSMFCN